MLDVNAPVLDPSDQGELYVVGLVGGKDVGKSSLVNALVGQKITQPTSFGPGTQQVIAYAHESSADELRALLEGQVPGRFAIVKHRIDHLKRQVLLDLPDIDSRYGEHVQITRKMLRHMLYPLWIQSVEKYADLRPQELLAAVGEGNDPANFIFCLNKADYCSAAQAAELRNDYATRVAKVLKLREPPQVCLISAKHPDQFDLPALRARLERHKPVEAVKQSLDLATRRQDRSLLGWVGRQGLGERAERLNRLERDSDELATTRLALPLLQRAIPQLLDDPGLRMSLVEPAVSRRLSRWPIINAIDALFSPLLSLVQKNLSAVASGTTDPDVYLGTPVSSLIQATFAQVHQLHPQQLGDIYRDRKLWESMHADAAATDLRRRFAAGLERQRQTILDRAGWRWPALAAPWRWLLTIGAILWFPIVQPILSVMLQQETWQMSKEALRVIVDLLSVSHLLQCATFLLLWFFVLWAYLRFSTQRKVNGVLDRWKSAGAEDESSLAGQTLEWTENLLEPIRRTRGRFESLAQRATKLSAERSAGAGSGRAESPVGAT
jgi:GTPase Era involved in 16S rRNA processing